MNTHLINWDSPAQIILTHTADLCHLFDATIPGSLHVRRMPVMIVPERIAHIIEKKDGRIRRLKNRPELIIRALESPEIVESRPEYLGGIGHYKLTYVAEDDQDPGVYVGVAVSLANFSDQPECNEHFALTVYCPEHRNFFTPQGEMKGRWRRVDWMPLPQKNKSQPEVVGSRG